MSSTEALFARARRHVEAQLKAQNSQKRRTLIARRLECVNNGLKAFQARRIADAAVYYQNFIKLMEDDKGVPDGGLSPSLFTSPQDFGDLLLISGVYWDLVRLFDRTQSDEKQAQFLHYLEKFILFSKGMTYQPLCAEGLRRYISAEKPVHKAAFKNAYKIIGDGRCFIVTSLLDVTSEDTLPALHRFRDEVLAARLPGKVFIRTYYWIGPALAFGCDRLPEGLRRRIGRGLDSMARQSRRFMRP